MKILITIPPHIPSYFNAGHHLPIFLTAAYLRKHYPDFIIHTRDLGVLNSTWKDMCDILIQQYEIIFVFFDYDEADGCERLVYYKNSISPKSHLVAFGRLVKEIPFFFIKRDFKAAHYKGDYECGLNNYIQFFLNNDLSLQGLVTPSHNKEDLKNMFAPRLEPEEWVLPDVNEIPYAAYNSLYKNDLNKFCGIPARMELVVPVARGCPVDCFFCDVPKMQGLKERRLSVSTTLNYIRESFDKLPFEYFTFYAPTFTLNRVWVNDFCNQKIQSALPYKWKCVTVLKTLPIELLKIMGEAGCVRISFGIESFDNLGASQLPKIKQNTFLQFQEICRVARECQIEINAFLILGLPGDSPQSMEAMMKICLDQDVRIRPTIYTPYEQLNDEMTVHEISAFNRQIFIPGLLSEEETDKFYQLFYNNKLDKPTKVMENIPIRS